MLEQEEQERLVLPQSQNLVCSLNLEALLHGLGLARGIHLSQVVHLVLEILAGTDFLNFLVVEAVELVAPHMVVVGVLQLQLAQVHRQSYKSGCPSGCANGSVCLRHDPGDQRDPRPVR